MIENPIPTKDLKTGAKIVGVVAKNTYEPLKPYIKREVGKQIQKILKALKV
jgi:hypothetical protein